MLVRCPLAEQMSWESATLYTGWTSSLRLHPHLSACCSGLLPCPTCSPITIIAATGQGPDQGVVCIRPPNTGGPYASYSCTPKYNGVALAPQTCNPPVRRRQLLGSISPCESYQGTVECWLNNLESLTPYE